MEACVLSPTCVHAARLVLVVMGCIQSLCSSPPRDTYMYSSTLCCPDHRYQGHKYSSPGKRIRDDGRVIVDGDTCTKNAGVETRLLCRPVAVAVCTRYAIQDASTRRRLLAMHLRHNTALVPSISWRPSPALFAWPSRAPGPKSSQSHPAEYVTKEQFRT